MEDTLRVCTQEVLRKAVKGLNPCFNGRYSQSYKTIAMSVGVACLNPCFNGRYSQRLLTVETIRLILVLILVLMEDTLRD